MITQTESFDNIQAVLAGTATWSCACADALDFLREMPDDAIDMIFTSPPYEHARTYGLKALPRGDDWVKWMVEFVTVAQPKVKGLIAINCEGQTKDYRYSCTPFLLLADLHRAGFRTRKPPIFHRFGIPGSGANDWLRNDWEPIICVTRPGPLPWSDPTARGHPPKFEVGGAMSHRTADGRRKNSRDNHETKARRTKGEKIAIGGRSHRSRTTTGVVEQVYVPPERVNPGNVIRCGVGGGHMGHALAHENEAPFPLQLAEFFVATFCRPGGVVCDPFSGSGTTCQAAVELGRRFIGCDVRESQADLCARRMATVTPPLFAM